MRDDQRSRTAEGTAAIRAAHQLLDAEPPVLADPFAERMLGTGLAPALRPWARARQRLESRFWERMPRGAGRLPIGTRRLRAQVVVRSRYVEDQLERAMAKGVDQYLLLAAGLDSFALRRRDLARDLQVYEVDHPATQTEKTRRIDALEVEWPSNLEMVPIDFESQSLSEACAASSFDPSRPAFVSWLGVTYYLTSEATEETLRFVAALSPGSEMAFDFWSAMERRPADRALLTALRFGVAGLGEQMVSFYEPSAMEDLVEAAGLEVLETVGRDQANARYLEGRRDGLEMPEFAYLATVGLRR